MNHTITRALLFAGIEAASARRVIWRFRAWRCSQCWKCRELRGELRAAHAENERLRQAIAGAAERTRQRVEPIRATVPAASVAMR